MFDRTEITSFVVVETNTLRMDQQNGGCQDRCPKDNSQRCGKSGVLRIYRVDSEYQIALFSLNINLYICLYQYFNGVILYTI